jgi:hypothetical protein
MKMIDTEFMPAEICGISGIEEQVLPFSLVKTTTVSMTKGWQCCKCRETMYNDEMFCTWNQCNHRRCNKCRSFIN